MQSLDKEAAVAVQYLSTISKEVEAKFTVTFVLDDNEDPKKATVFEKIEKRQEERNNEK